MTSGVYAITNLKTSEVYIGSSKNVESRFYNHKSALNAGRHHSCKLQQDWDEYGKSSFSFDLLQEVIELIDLAEIEQRLIHEYKAWLGYNTQKKVSPYKPRVNHSQDAVILECPYCHKPMSLNGKTRAGSQKYRCIKGCRTPEGKKVAITDSDRPPHRPKSGKAKSQAELTAAWKLRDPIGYAESQRRRNAKRNAKNKALKAVL
jgi:hypothetical protein